MTAKEYLQQIRRLDKDIRRLEERIQEYRELMYSSSGQQAGNNAFVGTNANAAAGSTEGSALENKVVKYTEKIKELQKLKEEKLEIKTRIELEIMSLDDARYVEILRYRYVDCMSWKRIISEMDYSKDWLWHLHGIALKEFQKQYQNTIKQVDNSTKLV